MSVLSEREAVRRLHDRMGFGPQPGDQDADFEGALSRLLDPVAAAGDPPPRLAELPAKKRADDQAAKKRINKQRNTEEARLREWWVDRMVTSTTPAIERLTWFWHGHFATSEQKVRSPRLMLAQNETFRRLGLGGFGELAHAMIIDPAMLLWLDGNDNKVGAANENLAREFMELFTLGHGHYSEQDVREAARALTGWTVRRTDETVKFRARRHDDEQKTLLGKTGDFDQKSFVDLLLTQPASASFVIGRLWFRMIGETPPSDQALAELLGAYGPGRDVRAVLRAMARRPEFHDSASVLVKQPVEWLVGLLRAVRLRPAELPERVAKQLNGGLRGMGQIPLRPPSVGGWPSGIAWLTTAAGVARLRTARLVAEHADLRGLGGGDLAGATGELLGVSAWTDRTRTALSHVDGDPKQALAIAASAPEYVVSR